MFWFFNRFLVSLLPTSQQINGKANAGSLQFYMESSHFQHISLSNKLGILLISIYLEDNTHFWAKREYQMAFYEGILCFSIVKAVLQFTFKIG